MDILAMENAIYFILTITFKRFIYTLHRSHSKAIAVTTPCINLAPSEYV